MPGRWRIQTIRLQGVLVEACWRPMEGDVAGDFHDVIDLRDGRAAIVIGDVAGYGSAAAHRADDLLISLRRAFRTTHRPTDVLEQVDAWVAAEPGDLFATMACALVDPAKRVVHVASAGHPPIAVVQGGTASFLNRIADPPLGIAAERRQISYPLAGDGALFLYTDGLIERRGTPLDENLLRLLKIAATMNAETGGGEALARRATDIYGQPADDATVVSVRLRPRAELMRSGERATGRTGREVKLRLYVDPRDLRSARTEAVARALERVVPPQMEIDIEVIDITAADGGLDTDGVMAVPTIVRVLPQPTIRVVGGIRSPSELARALHLPLDEEES